MNYLCHALPFLERPLALAGAVLPDWVAALDRRVKIRPWHLPERPPTAGTPAAEIHVGVRRHFHDDRWFHATVAFRDTVRELSASIREASPRRVRAAFYAHILTEVLLDAHVAETVSNAVRSFREALDALDPTVVAAEAARLVPVDAVSLASLVDRFRSARLIEAYSDDATVSDRLSAVGRRVRQPAFPGPEIVARARRVVSARARSLLLAQVALDRAGD